MLIIGSFPSVSSACSCVGVPSVEKEFGWSNAVFSGKVVEIKENRSLRGSFSKSVLFEVSNTWKGVKQSQIIIATGQNGGDCGFDFTVGEKYLVYSMESEMYGKKALSTTICDRTKLLNSSQEDLQILGEGKVPVEKVDLSGQLNGNQIYAWVAIVVALIAMGIGFIFILKKRKKSI